MQTQPTDPGKEKALETELADPRAPAADRAPRRRVGCLLIVYLLSLIALIGWCQASETPWKILDWHAESPNLLVRSASRTVHAAVRDLILFFPIGFLVAGSLATASRTRGCLSLVFALVAGFFVSMTLALIVRTGLNGLPLRRPSLPEIAVMVFVVFGGAWAGATLWHSRGPIRWMCGQITLLLLCLAGILVVVGWRGLESETLAFDSEPVATEDRRRLVRLFGDSDPRDIEPGATGQLTLTERDINQLLSWGLALGPAGQKARVHLDSDSVTVVLSSRIPKIQRYLNVVASGMVFVNEGELAIKPDSLQIGGLAVPRWLLVASGPSVIDKAFHNRHTRPFLSSLKDIRLNSGTTTVTYGHLELSKELFRDAFGALTGLEDMEPVMEAQIKRLVALAESSDGNLDFGSCLQAAFAEARARSASGDPVHENRGAILALGYLLGHDRIKPLVGPGLPKPTASIRRRFRAVSLRGRKDWTRHFTVSAALEVLSNATTSNMIGLLKEELDADGGSGFSFADLLADHSGTVFAKTATRSEASARAFQERLSSEYRVDAFFPPAADLPEGLSDAEFRQQYGGVGGEGYQTLMAEIERRISECEAYRQE